MNHSTHDGVCSTQRQRGRGVRFFAKVVYTVGVVVVVGYIKAARAAFGTFCYFRDIQRKKEKVLVGWYHCRNRELKPSQHATFNAHAPLHVVHNYKVVFKPVIVTIMFATVLCFVSVANITVTNIM